MSRPPRSAKEIIALVPLALFALLCLIVVIIGAVTPDKQTGQFAIQNAFLGLGPLVGSLGAMAMIWLRNRKKPAKGSLALASALWGIGATLSGFGLYTAFVPGDNSVLTNLGYSLALCLTPGAFFSALGLGTYWYSQWRKPTAGTLSTKKVAPPIDATASAYDDLRRRAIEYRKRITELIHERRRAAFADQLLPLIAKLDAWEQQVGRLVNRLTAFEADTVIQRDLREAPQRIAELDERLSAEPDPQVQAQMQETLDGHHAHREQLDALVSLMRRTRLQLDGTLAAMGTIYSQVQVLQAMDIDSDRARRSPTMLMNR